MPISIPVSVYDLGIAFGIGIVIVMGVAVGGTTLLW